MDLCYTTTWDSGIGSKHLRRLLIFVILCSLLLIKEINESESIALYPDICHIVFQTGILRLDFFFFFFLPRLNVCTTKNLGTAKLFASILIIVYRKNFISARIKMEKILGIAIPIGFLKQCGTHTQPLILQQ